MARPRSMEGPSAVERMEEAFFDQLRAVPFQKITISAIVKDAGVNRNSFYYHYADLDDLARSAVKNFLSAKIPALIASGIGPESEQFTTFLESADGISRLKKLHIIVGPHSTAELRNMLKSAAINAWLEGFQVTRTDLTWEEETTLMFVLAGILEMFGRIPARDMLEDLARTRQLPIVSACAEVMTATLTAASRRSR